MNFISKGQIMTSATAKPEKPKMTAKTSDASLVQRANRLLRTEVEFIPNSSFQTANSADDDSMLRFASVEERSVVEAKTPNDLPAHLARLCETPLLTAEEERDLFRAMNYLKYRVNVLRTQIDAESPDSQTIELAERFLKAATEIRDRIVQANMRLVMSIVKKFVSPQFPFDELLSDGIETLMQAVEKFDFDRGFRFSTYAYRSIARNAYRQTTARQKEFARFAASAGDMAEEVQDEDSVTINENSWQDLRSMLAKMLLQLDRRERYILAGRYTLGSDTKVKTFQSMADKLGVSKERVRQLEQRAVNKLRKMAAEMGMAELLEPSLQ
jgi:RNA polymerase primary sigma factor